MLNMRGRGCFTDADLHAHLGPVAFQQVRHFIEALVARLKALWGFGAVA
jgi:hypothetical protein